MILMVKKVGAVAAGLLVASVGIAIHSNSAFATHGDSASPLSIIEGQGKMTVLYNGKEKGPIDFGVKQWVPGATGKTTVEIRNEGEIDFVSSLTTGDYSKDSMANDFLTTVTDKTGKTLFRGAYSDVEVTGLDVPVGAYEKLTVSVRWMPSDDLNKSKGRDGKIGMNVTSHQKI
jgi:hypothetical protein